MASSSKTTALQVTFTQDDTKSFFQVVHKRGQRSVKHDRLLQPISAVGDTIAGTEVQFKLQKVGHMINTMYVQFQYVWEQADLLALQGVRGYSGWAGTAAAKDVITGAADASAFTDYLNIDNNNAAEDAALGGICLVDMPAMRAIQMCEIDFGSDNIVRISDDEMRIDFHLYRSDAEKMAIRHQTTDYSLGWVFTQLPELDTVFSGLNSTNHNGVYGLQYDTAAGVNFGGSAMIYGCKNGTQNAQLPPGGSAPSTEDVGGCSRLHHAHIEGGRPRVPNYVFYCLGKNSVLPFHTAATPQKLIANWTVEIPWTHSMSSDRNLPVALLDAEPIVKIRFRTTDRLIKSCAPHGMTQDLVSKAKLINPRLLVEYRDQPGPLLNALANEPSITYPLSHVLTQRFVMNPVSALNTFNINAIRGLVHTFAFMIRPSWGLNGGVATNVSAPRNPVTANNNALEGSAPTHAPTCWGRPMFSDLSYVVANIGWQGYLGGMVSIAGKIPPGYTSADAAGKVGTSECKLYDYDSLDFTNHVGFGYRNLVNGGIADAGVAAPTKFARAFRRMLKSWYLEANGERITGKTDIDARYTLNNYKSKYFPHHTEGEQPYLGYNGYAGTAACPRGYNLYAYTFGLDGSREAVGTGNVNFDALASIVLTLRMRDDIGPLPPHEYYVDVFGITANFTTVAGGNWFRQLS
jgi:hypothetical protein